jgi:excisionase family DNA binding protein
MTQKTPRLAYSIRETADTLSCSERWVRYLIESGELRAFRLGAERGVRVAHTELERFIRARQAAS